MFSGHFVAIVTPFNDGCVDFDSLKKLVDVHVEAKTDGLVLLGTTGERSSLSEEEERQIIKRAIDWSDRQLSVVVGTGCNDTQKSVERTRQAMELGADGCLVVVPYYNKPPVRGIIAHYKSIADVGLPVIAYHHPGRTGVRLNANDLKLIMQIDGVVALKEASGDLELCSELLDYGASLLCGDDHLTLEMMKMGAAGTISVVGNVIPRVWTEMVHACKAGSWDVAEERFKMCRCLLNALNTEVNPIAIKCAMSCLGLCGNELRLPLVTASSDSKKAMQDALLTFDRLDKSVELFS